VTLQRELWIIYKRFIKIEKGVYNDNSDKHNKKQEILSELPEDFFKKPPKYPTPRQKFLTGQMNSLNFSIILSEFVRKSEWEIFEVTDHLDSLDSIKTKLGELINNIQGTFEREQ